MSRFVSHDVRVVANCYHHDMTYRQLHGHVEPDFAEVAATLAGFLRRRPGGAAACVYHRGRCVVDIWGGQRSPDGTLWEQDTVAPSFSTTKGVMSTLVHILAEQGRLDYDAPVARYWPAFAQGGKGDILVRHVLCHEAGLYRLGDMVREPREMLDWPHMLDVVAGAEPVHAPGDACGYHALTYGWLTGGLIEAVTNRPLAQVLRDELVQPLGLDGAFIGLDEANLSRRALLFSGVTRAPLRSDTEDMRAKLLRLFRAGLGFVGVDLHEFQAALMPFDAPFDWNDEATVRACIPAANGQFTARSLARIYAMIAGGGQLERHRLLSPARVAEMGVVRNRARDNVLFIPMHWRLGFHRVFTLGLRVPQAFGHFGYGGSGAFCDPSRELAVALTVNSGTGTPSGDSRMPRIATAALRAVDRLG